MVGIFCTFRDSVLLFLILQETSSTVVQTCIFRVIDSCNLRLYQAVFNFCCSIVFCLVLSSRMSLFQKRLRLERSVSLKKFDFLVFDILIPFEKIFPWKI